MPIINMTTRKEDIPADAVNVRELKHNEGYGNTFPIWLYDSHIGLCLFDREMNGYDDSDFYMTVWNDEKQEPEEIMFASTRGWTYPCYGSKPDATPEVRAKYEAWKAARQEERRLAAIEAERKAPRKDKILKVVNGRPKTTEKRKLDLGVTGVCFWRGMTPFGESVGIKLETGEKLFTSIKNVMVVLEEN